MRTRRMWLVLLVSFAYTCTRDWSIWVPEPCDSSNAPRVFLSPTGDDAAPCTRELPCATFAHAYAIASPGDTIELAAGRYPVQLITVNPSMDDQHDMPPVEILFRPAAGAAVFVQGITVDGAQRVSFQCLGVGTDGWVVTGGAHNIAFRNVTAENGRFEIDGSSQVIVSGGSYGGTDDFGSEVWSDDAGRPSRDITIEGVLFHDTVISNLDAPASCLRLYGAASSTVRRNRFVRCALVDLFVSQVPEGATHDVVIENNFFGTPHMEGTTESFYSLQFVSIPSPWMNMTVRYNSSTTWIAFGLRDRPWSGMGNTVVGNLAKSDGDGYTCVRAPGITYARNVWTSGTPCDPTSDHTGPALFRDPDAVDLHLLAGSAGLGNGDMSNAPLTDIDGEPRPVDHPPAAGADEPH